jgi:hypothetical protein
VWAVKNCQLRPGPYYYPGQPNWRTLLSSLALAIVEALRTVSSYFFPSWTDPRGGRRRYAYMSYENHKSRATQNLEDSKSECRLATIASISIRADIDTSSCNLLKSPFLNWAMTYARNLTCVLRRLSRFHFLTETSKRFPKFLLFTLVLWLYAIFPNLASLSLSLTPRTSVNPKGSHLHLWT